MGKAVEVQVNDGKGFFKGIMVGDPEAIEEVLFAFEHGLQGRKGEGFAKPAGAGKEIVLVLVEQLEDERCFVYIQVTMFPDLTESLYANGVLCCHI
jgi:hypothetical protein